jgi:6-phosphogluconate dehydrogenase
MVDGRENQRIRRLALIASISFWRSERCWLGDCALGDIVEEVKLTTLSGEGRWTITAAIDEGAPAPVLSAALYQRFTSRGEEAFADKVLAAMRFAFGGHVERPTGG